MHEKKCLQILKDSDWQDRRHSGGDMWALLLQILLCSGLCVFCFSNSFSPLQLMFIVFHFLFQYLNIFLHNWVVFMLTMCRNVLSGNSSTLSPKSTTSLCAMDLYRLVYMRILHSITIYIFTLLCFHKCFFFFFFN